MSKNKFSIKKHFDEAPRSSSKLSSGWQPLLVETSMEPTAIASNKVKKSLKTLSEQQQIVTKKIEALPEIPIIVPEHKEEVIKEEAYFNNTPTLPKSNATEVLIDKAVNYISKELKTESSLFKQPDNPQSNRSINDLRQKLKFLEDWVSKISMTGSGSGSYFLHDMGDTNYEIVKHPSNNDLLAYNSANAKWEVATVESLTSLHTASYFSSVNQTANVSTQNYVTFNNIDFQNGFTNDGANIIPSFSGIYNLEFSLQIHYLGGGGAGNHFELWLEKNGVNQSNTNTAIHVSSNNPYNVAAWNFLVDLNANDKVALKWGVTNSQITLEAGGQLIGPSIPSAIITITLG